MKKPVKIAIASAAGALLIGNTVRAALYRPKDEVFPDFPYENVNLERNL
ncbi:MAG: hypothetical protein IKI33_02595 [Eubacterium sp.]|nr:hypothetical protein [Eubacterium sp.]